MATNDNFSSSGANNQLNSNTTLDQPNIAYVELCEATQMMTLILTLANKQRNMARQLNEPLHICLKRIELNSVDKKQTKPIRSTIESNLKANLYFNSELTDVNLTNREAWKNNSILIVGTNIYTICVNCPRILLLKLPSIVIENCPVVPSIDIHYSQPQDCRWYWYRLLLESTCAIQSLTALIQNGQVNFPTDLSLSQLNIEYLFEGIYYTPTKSDVGRKLVLICVPTDETGLKKGPPVADISTQITIAHPKPKLSFDRYLSTKNYTDQNHIRIICYNILADMWTSSKDSIQNIYNYCLPDALNSDRRQALTLCELTNFHADIICLQEVAMKRFELSLKTVLAVEGYEGHFACKTGNMPEGEAIFFRKERFSAIDIYSLHLGGLIQTERYLELYNSLLLWGEEVTYKFKSLGSIVQVAILQDNNCPNRNFIITNTHLYFDNQTPYIRLFQIALIVRHVEELKNKLQNENKNVSLLMCGDYNAAPDSGLCDFLLTGYIGHAHPDWQPYFKGVATPASIYPGISLNHSLQIFLATYGLPYTHFMPNYLGVLDYIFADTNSLQCENVIPMPEISELSTETALPNTMYPSDHLPVVCDLILNK